MMEILELDNKPTDWLGLRQRYVDLHERFLSILSPFDLEITATVNNDIKNLFHSMDYIDQLVEHVHPPISNDQFNMEEHLLSYLWNKDSTLHVDIQASVRDTLELFKNTLYEKNLQWEYVHIYRQVIESELCLSKTLDNNEYLSCSIEAGKLYASFFRALLWDVLNEKAAHFTAELIVAITLADNYKDLKDDYAEGRIKIKENKILKIKFLKAILRQCVRIYKLYPDKRRFLKWVNKFIHAVAHWSEC